LLLCITPPRRASSTGARETRSPGETTGFEHPGDRPSDGYDREIIHRWLAGPSGHPRVWAVDACAGQAGTIQGGIGRSGFGWAGGTPRRFFRELREGKHSVGETLRFQRRSWLCVLHRQDSAGAKAEDG